MTYDELNYNKEKDLIYKKIARNAVKRKYPIEYVEEISVIVEQYFELFKFTPNKELLNHPKVKEAYFLAEKAHTGQIRKYTDEDYIVHLGEVASFLSAIPGNTYEEVVAGLLHDIVEKGNVSLEFIKDNFGDNVRTYVDHLTDKASLEDGNRRERMIKNWNDFSQGPAKVHNMKAIDILSNTRSVMLCDAKYRAVYLEPIIEFINPYFQKCEHVDTKVKSIFQAMTEISKQIIVVQKNHNISKLEKDYSNKLRNEKKILTKFKSN